MRMPASPTSYTAFRAASEANRHLLPGNNVVGVAITSPVKAISDGSEHLVHTHRECAHALFWGFARCGSYTREIRIDAAEVNSPVTIGVENDSILLPPRIVKAPITIG